MPVHHHIAHVPTLIAVSRRPPGGSTTSAVPADVVRVAAELSPYPPSFANNGYLYFAALASLLAISICGGIIVRWMLTDLWKFRHRDHPSTLIFGFRVMMMLCGSAALVRCLPEVAYMTCFADPSVSPRVMANILIVKRAFDILALPTILGWMAILSMIYPFVSIALTSGEGRAVRIDVIALWPRLAKPAIVLVVVLAISFLMAIAKGTSVPG